MSLAMFAAPIDDTNIITQNSDILHQKRQHKRTLRKYPKIEPFDANNARGFDHAKGFNAHKVKNVLEHIHNNAEDDDDDFQLLPPPESMNVQRTIPPQSSPPSPSAKEGFNFMGNAPTSVQETNDLDLNDYSNYGTSQTAEDYYRRVLPGYKRAKHAVGEEREPVGYVSQDALLQKLNYLITLMEDKQDEKTNHVTEEVILYSFLGIFVIFLADTFVRAGKYVR